MATSNGVWVIKFLLNREDQEFHLKNKKSHKAVIYQLEYSLHSFSVIWYMIFQISLENFSLSYTFMRNGDFNSEETETESYRQAT